MAVQPVRRVLGCLHFWTCHGRQSCRQRHDRRRGRCCARWRRSWRVRGGWVDVGNPASAHARGRDPVLAGRGARARRPAGGTGRRTRTGRRARRAGPGGRPGRPARPRPRNHRGRGDRPHPDPRIRGPCLVLVRVATRPAGADRRRWTGRRWTGRRWADRRRWAGGPGRRCWRSGAFPAIPAGPVAGRQRAARGRPGGDPGAAGRATARCPQPADRDIPGAAGCRGGPGPRSAHPNSGRGAGRPGPGDRLRPARARCGARRPRTAASRRCRRGDDHHPGPTRGTAVAAVRRGRTDHRGAPRRAVRLAARPGGRRAWPARAVAGAGPAGRAAALRGGRSVTGRDRRAGAVLRRQRDLRRPGAAAAPGRGRRRSGRGGAARPRQ